MGVKWYNALTMKKKSISRKILEEFLDFLRVMNPENFAELGPYGQIRYKKFPRTTYYRKIYKFEKQNLLIRKSTAAGNTFIISEKAKKLRRKPSNKVNRTDGLSSLIIFDVPQKKNNARHTLRRFLIRNGYTQIRESCFLSPFKVSLDIVSLIKELGLEKNVSVFSAKSDYIF